MNWSLMPSEEQKIHFAVEYLSIIKSGVEARQFVEECGVFELLSHLHWTLWGLMKERQGSEFDYFGYAIGRLQKIVL